MIDKVELADGRLKPVHNARTRSSLGAFHANSRYSTRWAPTSSAISAQWLPSKILGSRRWCSANKYTSSTARSVYDCTRSNFLPRLVYRLVPTAYGRCACRSLKRKTQAMRWSSVNHSSVRRSLKSWVIRAGSPSPPGVRSSSPPVPAAAEPADAARGVLLSYVMRRGFSARRRQ